MGREREQVIGIRNPRGSNDRHLDLPGHLGIIIPRSDRHTKPLASRQVTATAVSFTHTLPILCGGRATSCRFLRSEANFPGETPEDSPEVTGQVALVREADLGRDVRNRSSHAEERTSSRNTQGNLIMQRREARRGKKRSLEVVRTYISLFGEFGQGDLPAKRCRGWLASPDVTCRSTRPGNRTESPHQGKPAALSLNLATEAGEVNPAYLVQ